MSTRNTARRIAQQVFITGETLTTHKTDDEGRQIWWFGSAPVDGVPLPGEFLRNLQAKNLRKIGPPWAAIAVGTKDEGTWACTDAIGLQHLFLRNVGKDIIVGPDVFQLAACSPVHLDPIGAYELFCRGNPQEGRTLFSEIRLIPPACQIRLDTPYTEYIYWSLPRPSPSDPEHAITTFVDAVIKAVAKNWCPGYVLELTGGRDSMLNLAAYLEAGIRVDTWTHGRKDDFDMVAASVRAKSLGLAHQPIFSEALQELSPSEAGSLAIDFLNASGGQANVLEYWHLRWVLEQLKGTSSISGVGGEVFRGFYYEWTGRGRLPRWLVDLMLLRGKARHSMPFPAAFLDKRFKNIGEEAVHEELRALLEYRNTSYHSLDEYYLSKRMHHFCGTTWSTTGRWHPVRAPLFDPGVIDCLSLVPTELRDRSRLVDEATRRLLRNPPSVSLPKLQKTKQIVRLYRKIRNARGAVFGDFQNVTARLVLNSPQAKSALVVDDMRTGSLYNKAFLRRYIAKTMAGKQAISLPLGALLTIELSARAVGNAFKGIDI
jgi:hypothetical protein